VSGLEELRCRLIEIADSPERRERIAKASRAYFESAHQLDSAMERFERMFRDIV
jgi:glycosyltransferase involved in cell wall biosynthesis